MLDALGVAVCLADSRDDDAPILYVNDAFEAMTGWPSESALGRDLEAVLGAAAGEVDRPGRSVLPIRRRDGSSVRCELTVTEVPAMPTQARKTAMPANSVPSSIGVRRLVSD